VFTLRPQLDRARWTRELVPAGNGRFHAEPWRHQRLQP
jgi:hypothetical protein